MVEGYDFSASQPATDYGHPMKPFSIKIINIWAWADRADNWDIWGTFKQLISTHLGPLSMFSINVDLDSVGQTHEQFN